MSDIFIAIRLGIDRFQVLTKEIQESLKQSDFESISDKVSEMSELTDFLKKSIQELKEPEEKKTMNYQEWLAKLKDRRKISEAARRMDMKPQNLKRMADGGVSDPRLSTIKKAIIASGGQFRDILDIIPVEERSEFEQEILKAAEDPIFKDED